MPGQQLSLEGLKVSKQAIFNEPSLQFFELQDILLSIPLLYLLSMCLETMEHEIRGIGCTKLCCVAAK